MLFVDCIIDDMNRSTALIMDQSYLNYFVCRKVPVPLGFVDAIAYIWLH